MEYCNGIESPPLYLYSFDKNGMPEYKVNILNNQTLAYPSSVNQNEPIKIVDNTVSSSVITNGKRHRLGLDQIRLLLD